MANWNRNNTNNIDNEDFDDLSNDPSIQNINQQKDYYRQQMIASSNRSVQMITESQTTAMETAEELRKQREQLERTNKNLDKINSDLDHSERHITSLKSVWGTIGNWFKKPLLKQEPTENVEATDPDAQLRESNKQLKENLQKLDRNTDLRFEGGSLSTSNRSKTTEDEIVDNNLDTLLAGLTVLKGQGIALGNEIDEQDKLLDDIQKKSEIMDSRIEGQSKNIRGILRK